MTLIPRRILLWDWTIGKSQDHTALAVVHWDRLAKSQ